MNKDIFVENIQKWCAIKGVSITAACKESGAGRSLMDNIKRGRAPSIDRAHLLAEYLDTTVSELIGEPLPQYGGDPDVTQLAIVLAQLNAEGREKLLDYADDLVASQKYIKTGTVAQGQELA